MAFTQITRSIITRVASKSSLMPSALAIVVPSSYICYNVHERNRRIAVCEPQDSDELPASNESVDRSKQHEQTSDYQTTISNLLSFFDDLEIDAVFFNCLSIGALVGFCAGFAMKKAGKLLVLVVGIGTISVKTLASYGYVTVDYEKMENDFKTLMGIHLTEETEEKIREGLDTAVETFSAGIGSASGFTSGFLVGLMIG